jgi:hypothetical protein
MTKAQFCEQYNLTEGQFNGTEKIEGTLYLRSLKSIPEGFNPTVGGGLYLNSLTSIPEGFNPTVGGGLNLGSLTSIPEGFNPIVGGGLNLGSLTSIPEGFNPAVGGSLYLHSLTSIPEGFNPIVGGDLYLGSLTSIPKGFNPTVGDGLYLHMLTSIPEGFNPTIGGWLDLRSLKSIPEGFNPTIGDGIDLDSLTSIPEGFNPTVGGDLYLGSLPADIRNSITYNKLPEGYVFDWGNYCKVDGMFTEVISRKGLIWKVNKVNKAKILYIVFDGNGRAAHGATIKEAKASLIYKITDRDTSRYTNLTLSSVLGFPQMVELYRVITGACAAGTRSFVESMQIEQKDYSIKEVIKMTEGQYGNQSLVEFFKGK